MSEEVRLQKFLSQAGVTSRRKAEAWMLAGRVSVNGQTCRELGTKIVPGKDRVEVDGKPVHVDEDRIYILLYKPTGYITSTEDPEERPVVTDLLPRSLPRVWPVGRLDWDSEGALLMTNDGELTHRLTHPSFESPKEYAVKVQGMVPTDAPLLETFRQGMDIGEGDVTQPAEVSIGGDTGKNTWILLKVHEGKNRQIRRMCEAVNLRVMKLKRLGVGPVPIGRLQPGEFRPLLEEEVLELRKSVGLEGASVQTSKRSKKREGDRRDRGRKYDVRKKGSSRGKGPGKKK